MSNAAPIHAGAGLYIVTLTNEHPISVNADRPAIAAGCFKVTRENCKFGCAVNLHRRRRDYFKTFGERYVQFHALASVNQPKHIETLVARQLIPHRIRGANGRLNEWLAGITPQEVEAVMLATLENSGFPYRILGTVAI